MRKWLYAEPTYRSIATHRRNWRVRPGVLKGAIAAPLAGSVVPIASRINSGIPTIDARVTAAPLDLRVPRDSSVITFPAEAAAIPAGEFSSGIQHAVSTIATLSIKGHGAPARPNNQRS